MITHPSLIGPLRRVKGHYNLSAGDFVVTGMASLALGSPKQINVPHITISICKEAWVKLLEAYPHLKEKAFSGSIRKSKYIKLFEHVYAECEDVPKEDYSWFSGFQLIKPSVTLTELQALANKTTDPSKKAFYGKWIDFIRS